MQADKIYKKFLETAKYYLKELDFYGKNQFRYKPNEKDWSIGQLYDHLINGTYAYHFKQIENCLKKTGGSEKGDKKFKGRMLFFLKSFPSMRIKGVPSSVYTPGQPESPVKVKDELYRFIKSMQSYAKDIDAAGTLTYKVSHPSLGMLTALEWYTLVEMHFRHHLKQKARLDAIVRSYKKEEESLSTADEPYQESDFN
ncbi:MAG: DinB family protein [Cytophagaceae bacterium]